MLTIIDPPMGATLEAPGLGQEPVLIMGLGGDQALVVHSDGLLESVQVNWIRVNWRHDARLGYWVDGVDSGDEDETEVPVPDSS